MKAGVRANVLANERGKQLEGLESTGGWIDKPVDRQVDNKNDSLAGERQ